MAYVVPGSDPSTRTDPEGLNTEFRPLKRQAVDDVDDVITKTASEIFFAPLWKSHATDIDSGPDTSTNLTPELRLLKEQTVVGSVKRSIHIKSEMCVPLSLTITVTDLIFV